MIDERSLRRPEFDESSSVPVVFNGTTLFLRRPTRMIRPIFVNGKAQGVRRTTDDPEMDALIEAVEQADTYGTVIDLAVHMIRKNYDIDDEALGELLTYDPADESADSWPRRVMSMAYGRSPAPSPASEG